MKPPPAPPLQPPGPTTETGEPSLPLAMHQSPPGASRSPAIVPPQTGKSLPPGPLSAHRVVALGRVPFSPGNLPVAAARPARWGFDPIQFRLAHVPCAQALRAGIQANVRGTDYSWRCRLRLVPGFV